MVLKTSRHSMRSPTQTTHPQTPTEIAPTLVCTQSVSTTMLTAVKCVPTLIFD